MTNPGPSLNPQLSLAPSIVTSHMKDCRWPIPDLPSTPNRQLCWAAEVQPPNPPSNPTPSPGRAAPRTFPQPSTLNPRRPSTLNPRCPSTLNPAPVPHPPPPNPVAQPRCNP